jgi:RimJ/RimL family protein N-acetyltransferase
MQRLELRGDADNVASRRVAERCGYTLEGILRSVYFKEGRRSDMFIYSRLPGDD